MATGKSRRPVGGEALRVLARIEPDEEGRRPRAAAYAFSGGGRLLASAPLDEDGGASLKLPRGAEPSAARIVVGPELENPELSELVRLGVVERHIRLDPGKLPPLDLTIHPDQWRCWLLSRCTVRGTLLKRTNRDGQPLDLPVCGATVEVYEVDPLPLLIPRLPDHILDRIRDIILDPVPDPFPDPFPPGPIPDPFPPGPLPPGPFPPPGPGPEPGPLRLHEPPPALRMAAKSGSGVQLREALILHPDLLRPLICHLAPRFVTKTLLGTAQTDDCGHFTFSFFRGCRNPDEPDLYFRATQPWFFGDMTIYDPKPVACHTRWNYKCGTEVTLYTTSPFARTCEPCPPKIAGDDYVLVMHVGNLPVSNIRGVAQALETSTTPATRGLTAGDAPFGGTLRPHLEFDPDLRAQHDVRFYRVSVRRAGTAGPWIPLDQEVHRNYVFESGGFPVIAPYSLGPQYPFGGPEPFYEIPPAVPPAGVWTIADAVQNMANAHWDSTAEAPGVGPLESDLSGKFEMRIELFHGTGAPVDLAATGIHWVVPVETDLSSPTVINTEPPAPGVVQGNAFVMTLHVDNNVCEASTDPPTVNGSPASDHCGVMRYTPPQSAGDTVTLPYRAAHRNGYATHSFVVQRGITGLTPPSTSGPVGGGTFSATSDVLAMLSQGLPPGADPCTIGAFLELVYVAALATDGWQRLSGYDRGASRAFTLAPASP